MKKQKPSYLIKLIALILVLSLITPCTASAVTTESITPYASKYLSLYSAYVYVTTSGEVQVWFEVMGADDLDEIGALRIVLYESSDNSNWDDVKTFLYESTSNMLFYDDDYISSHVSWQGTYGKYYKAYVTIWGGKNGNGDTRYIWAYQP